MQEKQSKLRSEVVELVLPDGSPLDLLVRARTIEEVSSTHFRGSQLAIAGNFSRWNSLLEFIDDEDVRRYLELQVQAIIDEDEDDQDDFTDGLFLNIEMMVKNCGWQEFDDGVRYANYDLDLTRFGWTHIGVVRSEKTFLKAPVAHVWTGMFMLSLVNGRGWILELLQLFPGARTEGSELSDYVFFPKNHPGEYLEKDRTNDIMLFQDSIEGTGYSIRVTAESKQELEEYRFCGRTHAYAGNFHLWSSVSEFVKEPDVQEWLTRIVRKMQQNLPTESEVVEIYESMEMLFCGWSTTMPFSECHAKDRERFNPSAESYAFRVQSSALCIEAPIANEFTGVFQVEHKNRYGSKEIFVYIIDLYPGKVVHPLVGNVGLREQVVFFPLHHPGVHMAGTRV